MAVLSQSNLSLNSMKNMPKHTHTHTHTERERERVTYSKSVLRFIHISRGEKTAIIILKEEEKEKKEENECERSNFLSIINIK